MAWQSGAGGSGQGGMAPGEQNGVQAYTLQGVMRFLQTEWHRHERDRNAWEIEREEMKNRIAALEGETRTSKGLRTSLERHIKLLETALKKEREKARGLAKGEPVDTTKEARELAREELKAAVKDVAPKNISLFDSEIDPENHLAQGVRQEKERDKSKGFLSKCSSEITYHVIPNSTVPAELHDLSASANINHIISGRQPTQQELQEAYIQLQQIKQQSQQNQQHIDVAMVRENAMSNHQQQHSFSDPQPLQRSNTQINHQDLQVRESGMADQLVQSAPSTNARKDFYSDQMSATDDQVETISHSFDAYGRDISPKDHTEPRLVDDKTEVPDGWDFDDGPAPVDMPQEQQIQLRPDVETFPSANLIPSKSPPRAPGSYRRKSSGARRRSEGNNDTRDLASAKPDNTQFKVRFAMRGHLDVVRAVIFTGGGSPSEPEFCTASDDGGVKRWHIPVSYGHSVALGDDLDRIAHFTHRGHVGAVCCLAACPASASFSSGGRAAGDGWIFSGGEDTTVKVWERGRVDAKATLEGHKDAVWAICCLPGSTGTILGERCSQYGGPDRVLLIAAGADGTILIWAVSTPPQLASPQAGSRSTRGSRRANSISAGSNFPSSPQPSVASNIPFSYSLVHRIERTDNPAPTSISPLGAHGESFVVAYNDASVLVFDTRTGEEIVGMASQETYDGTTSTAVNAVVASSTGFDTTSVVTGRRGSMGEDDVVHGATGSEGGVEGVVIAGYEDRFIRFFDANSGQCTYTMLAHPSAISSLSLSPDGKELVSGGHDASLRFWSLEKRNCTQEISNHRIMRGEGVCSVVWSPDGRWVISCGGDGAVKVFSRG